MLSGRAIVRDRRLFWLLITVGVVVRVVLAFTTPGGKFDMQSVRLVYDQLVAHPFHVYGDVRTRGAYRWPYPPAYFPWIVATGKLARLTGWPLHAIFTLPAIAADLALAWLVQGLLGRRGATEEMRLVAAALVLLGPVFVGISGYSGQFDSVAILPAFAALVIWEDRDRRRRALWAGFLIGVGAALKTVPILMLIALLPTVRGWREALTLVAAAVAVPLAFLAPYLITEPSAVQSALHYAGGPGTGGLTLAVQPDIARSWLTFRPVQQNGLLHLLIKHGRDLDFLVAGVTLALLAWRRTGALAASVILWLMIYAFGSGFFFQYLIWGLPFFIAAGYLWQSAVLQLWAIAPGTLLYLAPWRSEALVTVYGTTMLMLWLGYLAALWRVLPRGSARAQLLTSRAS
jgi:hypothetical protein